MLSRMSIPVFFGMLAMFLFPSSRPVEAEDRIRVTIGGGSHHYRSRDRVRYRTSDSGFRTWYPEYRSTYGYPVVYRTDPHFYSYYDPYIYYTPSTNFSIWFGSDGRRHYGHHPHYRNNSRNRHRR